MTITKILKIGYVLDDDVICCTFDRNNDLTFVGGMYFINVIVFKQGRHYPLNYMNFF